MKKQRNALIVKTILGLACILSISSLVFTSSVAYAQTATPKQAVSPTPNQALNEKLNNQINQLKDKIASRVTELNLVEKRGIIGVVTEASTNKVTIADVEGNTRQIDIDEITKFSSASAKGSFGLSDLTKGTRISILGLYNKQSKRILARFIRTSVDPVFLTGGISETDSKNITLTMVSEDKKLTKIDIQPATKISSYSKDDGQTKILFGGLNIGDRIFVIGFPDKTDSEMIVANRVIVFSDLPKDPKISIVEPSPTVVPTTPLRRVTPAPAVTSSIKRLTPTIAR